MHFYVGILFVLFNLFHGMRSQRVDLTLTEGASGVHVVDATIEKLENLFPNDLGLLKRIALVETNFGSNISDSAGGIWKISAHIYSQISEPSSQLTLLTYIARATLEFGLSVTNLSNADFSVPLRSALAARLYIQLIAGTNVPGPINSQAIWWETNYNPSGDQNRFEDVVTTYENLQSCSVSRLDLWLLVDGSGSIGSANFLTTLDFVANISAEFKISPDEVRVGFSVYTNSHRFISMFNQDTNNTDFTNKVLSTSYTGGGTATGNAINNVVVTGFNESNGLRPISAGVPRVLVVLTDGRSGDDVVAPANMARDQGITTYAVGIGGGIDNDELEQIAGATSRVFELVDFSQLLSVLERQLTTGACQASAEIPDNTTVAVSIEPGNTYYSSIQLPNNGSVQLEYNIDPASNGTGIVYGSLTVVRPNSALHDFFAVLTVGNTVISVNCPEGNDSVILAGLISRKRRSTGVVRCQTVFVALESTGEAPLVANFTSSPSLTKAPIMTSPATTVATTAATITTTTTCDPPTTNKHGNKRPYHFAIPFISLVTIVKFLSLVKVVV